MCYVNGVEEKRPYEFEVPTEIRRTHIETYRKCPNKFKLEVLEGNEQPPRTYTQVGIDLHEVFEKAVNDRTFGKQAQINLYMEYINEHRKINLYVSQEEEDAFTKRAMDCIKTFNEILPSLPMPFATEVTIHYKIKPDLPSVRFTMDLIIENPDGTLTVIDWKTGKELVGKQLASDLQAPLYAYGVEQEYGKKVSQFIFYYLKDNKTRIFNRVAEGEFVCTVGKREYFIRYNDMISEVQRLFTHIKNGNFKIPQDTRGMFFTCKMCHLQEMGLCLGADNEAWKQLKGGS